MYLIKFKEFSFDLQENKELFFVRDKFHAQEIAEELNDELQNIIKQVKEQGILGCVEIPELGIFISSVSNICMIESVELKEFEPIKDLTFTHLL